MTEEISFFDSLSRYPLILTVFKLVFSQVGREGPAIKTLALKAIPAIVWPSGKEA